MKCSGSVLVCLLLTAACSDDALLEFGEACADNFQCASSLCVALGPVSACTQECKTAPCPGGAPCVTAGATKYCKPVVEGAARYGEACSDNSSCADSLCVNLGKSQVCSRDCSAAACPGTDPCVSAGQTRVCKPGGCAPDCKGKQCGDDGCGGKCGTCNTGFTCAADLCTKDALKCPTGMVPTGVDGVCIDIYEASWGSGGIALSEKNTLPWNEVSQVTAKDACKASGKRLCTTKEWLSACQGPKGNKYAYGDTFQSGVCNHAVYGSGEATVMKTGANPGCKSDSGTYDQSGNVAEWVSDNCKEDTIPPLDGTLCALMGGGIMEMNAGTSCGYYYRAVITYSGSKNLGFRCCKTVK